MERPGEFSNCTILFIPTCKGFNISVPMMETVDVLVKSRNMDESNLKLLILYS